MSVRILKAMKKTSRFISALAAAVIVAASLSGCGSDNEHTISAHYEAVLETLTQSVRVLDTNSYLKCFSQAARAEYVSSPKYEEDLCEKLAERDGQKQLALVYIVNDHNELDNDAITKLKNEYKQKYAKRIDITKAYEIQTEFTAGEKTSNKTLIVYNDGHEWKIYGNVIDSFFEER